jgi:hypothetical protein
LEDLAVGFESPATWGCLRESVGSGAGFDKDSSDVAGGFGSLIPCTCFDTVSGAASDGAAGDSETFTDGFDSLVTCSCFEGFSLAASTRLAGDSEGFTDVFGSLATCAGFERMSGVLRPDFD